MAAFTVDGVHHALVAARLSAEFGIGVRHGCFCAHPYVVRLLGLADHEVAAYRSEVLRATTATSPGRFGPAPACARRGRISTRCWLRCPIWPAGLVAGAL